MGLRYLSDAANLSLHSRYRVAIMHHATVASLHEKVPLFNKCKTEKHTFKGKHV